MRSGRNVAEPGVPRVSVLLVVRDAGRFVGEAVDSILAQSFGDFELLIYDDGSTDDSCEVLERAAGRDLRVQLFREQAQGLGAWLRRGIEDARGEFVARMDADDISHPERLARQVAFLDAHPECVALGSEVLLVDPQRRPIRKLGVSLRHDEIDAALLHGRAGALLDSATTYRRDAVIAVGGYRPQLEGAEVLDLNLRLAESGVVANLPETLLEYRQHVLTRSTVCKGDSGHGRESALREACRRRGIPESDAPSPVRVPRRMPAADAWHRWASWAIAAGNLATGRRYAWRVFRREPFSRRSCSLGLHALLGTRLATVRRLQGRLQGLVDGVTLGRMDPERAGPRNR